MPKINSANMGGELPEIPEIPPAVQTEVSQAASTLGRRAKGVPKTLTDQERKRRAEAMREVGKANRRVVTIRGLKFTPSSNPGRSERTHAGPRVTPQARGPIAVVRGQAAQIVNQASRNAASRRPR